MNTQKHTSGPWKIAENHCDNLTEKHIAWTNLREVLAPKNGDTTNDEDYANCKLIAAAPELLEALKALLVALQPKMTRKEAEASLMAIKAIKKATL